MFETIRSDDFSKFYKNWQDEGPAPNPEMISKIENNLNVISSAGKIKDLEFDPQGTIKVTDKPSITTSRGKRDLEIFSQFAKHYLKKYPLEEEQAQKILSSLDSAKDKLRSLDVSKNCKKSLQKASTHVLMKEKIEVKDSEMPGQKLIAEQFLKVRDLASMRKRNRK